MNHQHFEFLPLSEADLPRLAEWLARPHLQKWWREGEVSTPDGHAVMMTYNR